MGRTKRTLEQHLEHKHGEPGDWYCTNCGYLDGSRVTFSETCDDCHHPVEWHTSSEQTEIQSLRTQLANIRSAIPKREYPPFLKVETLAHEALYLVEQVETYRDECEAIRTKLAEAEKRAEVAEAREASLLEAVTASAETKRAYTSEFSIGFPEFDSENDEYMRKSIVPWITIKEIMRVIKDRAIAARQGEGGEG